MHGIVWNTKMKIWFLFISKVKFCWLKQANQVFYRLRERIKRLFFEGNRTHNFLVYAQTLYFLSNSYNWLSTLIPIKFILIFCNRANFYSSFRYLSCTIYIFSPKFQFTSFSLHAGPSFRAFYLGTTIWYVPIQK